MGANFTTAAEIVDAEVDVIEVEMEVIDESDDNESEQPANTTNTANAHALDEKRRCAADAGHGGAGASDDASSLNMAGEQIAAAGLLVKIGGTGASKVRLVRSP